MELFYMFLLEVLYLMFLDVCSLSVISCLQSSALKESESN